MDEIDAEDDASSVASSAWGSADQDDSDMECANGELKPGSTSTEPFHHPSLIVCPIALLPPGQSSNQPQSAKPAIWPWHILLLVLFTLTASARPPRTAAGRDKWLERALRKLDQIARARVWLKGVTQVVEEAIPYCAVCGIGLWCHAYYGKIQSSVTYWCVWHFSPHSSAQSHATCP